MPDPFKYNALSSSVDLPFISIEQRSQAHALNSCTLALSVEDNDVTSLQLFWGSECFVAFYLAL